MIKVNLAILIYQKFDLQGVVECAEGEGDCATAVDNYMEQFEEVVR